MCEVKLRAATEADITAALGNTSLSHWLKHERDILEVVNLVIRELEPDVAPTGAAGDPYRFLSRIR